VVGAALALGALVLGALAGCGGSGASTSSTAGSARAAAATTHANEGPAQSRGTKGESPTTEAATSQRISGADCARLGAVLEGRLGRPLGHDPKPTPPLSACRISGHGVAVNLSLDSGFAAHQRYMNRMDEAVQFGAPDPSRVPHPVARVGEKGPYDEYANWIPAFGTLYALRGNRWLTVNYSVAGEGNRRSRAGAADLGRLAFRLTAH
jgi:hypothetical protein